ncbi:hypothetical protein ABEB36_007178 [Hypothenemus hampei]|uniref:Myb/SANT-like DNA-binding domain-containing protein n=1 Tax=Hypothenemus hampei TaxID=57062 RepID=A0ABD1ET88_HYPHA
MCDEEVIEFIVLPPSTAEEPADENADSFKWNHGSTLALIELYKKYRQHVGTFKIRTLKKMFEQISKELQVTLKQKVSCNNCENRWKHLARSYKKYKENMNKTGRGRKDFEYAIEMNEIFGEKRNINPILVLSSDTISKPNEEKTDQNSIGNMQSSESEHTNFPPTLQHQEATKGDVANESKVQKHSKYRNKLVRADVLKEIRRDRQEYYKVRLGQEEKKLKIKKEKNKI